MRSPSYTDYFPALTGVRALAAFMVFFHHADQQGGLELPYSLHRLLMEFHAGVSVFFVLSGFLITYRYYEKFVSQRINVGNYLIKRFARIYPMFFLLSIGTFCYHYLFYGKWDSVFTIATNLTLVKGYFSEVRFSGIAQTWSLTVEETFYLLAPLLFLFYHRAKRFLPMLVVLLVFGFLPVVSKSLHGYWYGFINTSSFAFCYTFFGRCFEFLTGMWLALYLRNRKASETFNRGGAVHTATGGLAMVAVMVLMGCIAHIGGVKYSIQTLPGTIVNNFVFPVAVAVVFSGLLRENSLMRRCLESRLFQLLGKSSYVFYLIHMGFVSSLVAALIPFSNPLGKLLCLFILLNLIAFFLHRIVEEPLYLLIKRRAALKPGVKVMSSEGQVRHEMYTIKNVEPL